MSGSRLRTVLVGLGKMGVGYADDPALARFSPFAAHAQVLAAHPRFAWEAAVDPDRAAREAAQERFGLPIVAATAGELPGSYQPDVAIVAAPPDDRLALLAELRTIRGAILEKPLGATFEEAREIERTCRARGLVTQVNLTRRGDALLQRFAEGGLAETIGDIQAISGVYGRGLANNGTHLIDLVRMLAGDVVAVRALADTVRCPDIPGDVQVPLALTLASGVVASFHALDFAHYRENGLEIWGSHGRLSILQSGFGVQAFPRRQNRALTGADEIASDAPVPLDSCLGQALYRMYDNLADALDGVAELWSPPDGALRAAEVVAAARRSARTGGAAVSVAGGGA